MGLKLDLQKSPCQSMVGFGDNLVVQSDDYDHTARWLVDSMDTASGKFTGYIHTLLSGAWSIRLVKPRA